MLGVDLPIRSGLRLTLRSFMYSPKVSERKAKGNVAVIEVLSVKKPLLIISIIRVQEPALSLARLLDFKVGRMHNMKGLINHKSQIRNVEMPDRPSTHRGSCKAL